jgi:hypothetical protein
MGKAVAPDHKTGNGEWNGGCAFVSPLGNVTGSAGGAVASEVFIAPFDFFLKDAVFYAKLGNANAAAKVNLNVAGSAVLVDFAANGLATGASATMMTAASAPFIALDYLVKKGQAVTFDLEALADFAGSVVICGNPA